MTSLNEAFSLPNPGIPNQPRPGIPNQPRPRMPNIPTPRLPNPTPEIRPMPRPSPMPEPRPGPGSNRRPRRRPRPVPVPVPVPRPRRRRRRRGPRIVDRNVTNVYPVLDNSEGERPFYENPQLWIILLIIAVGVIVFMNMKRK